MLLCLVHLDFDWTYRHSTAIPHIQVMVMIMMNMITWTSFVVLYVLYTGCYHVNWKQNTCIYVLYVCYMMTTMERDTWCYRPPPVCQCWAVWRCAWWCGCGSPAACERRSLTGQSPGWSADWPPPPPWSWTPAQAARSSYAPDWSDGLLWHQTLGKRRKI